MLRSMTAYGRAFVEGSLGRVTVELQSVNRKFLEMHLNLPAEMRKFDSQLRKWLGARLWYGQVSVHVAVRFSEHAPVRVVPNLALASQLYHAWQKVATHLGLSLEKHFDWQLLLKEPGILQIEGQEDQENELLAHLQKATNQALDALIAMKMQEGAYLKGDLEMRLSHLTTLLDQIRQQTLGAPDKCREKLAARLEEVLPGRIENDERLLREVLLYAEKMDVSEEITRLRSHFQQFKALLDGREGGVGKTLDFLVQEMHREVNTLGTKAGDLHVTPLVVAMKAELTKIREQIQNVE